MNKYRIFGMVYILIWMITLLGIIRVYAQGPSLVLFQNTINQNQWRLSQLALTRSTFQESSDIKTPGLLVMKMSNLLIDQLSFPNSKEIKLLNKYNSSHYLNNEVAFNFAIDTHEVIRIKNYELNGKFRFRACHGKRCLYPKNIDLTLKIYIP